MRYDGDGLVKFGAIEPLIVTYFDSQLFDLFLPFISKTCFMSLADLPAATLTIGSKSYDLRLPNFLHEGPLIGRGSTFQFGPDYLRVTGFE
jgi:hypothetical protein